MRKFATPIAAGAVTLALVAGLYRVQSEATEARGRIEALEDKIADAEGEVRRLAAEAAALSRPARIEALAQRKLGVGPASLEQLDAIP